MEREALVGEADFNYLLTDDNPNNRRILKVCRDPEVGSPFGFQVRTLRFLEDKHLPIAVPRVLLGPDGNEQFLFDIGDGKMRWAILLSYIPGQMLVEFSPHSADMIWSIGQGLGALDRELYSLHDPEAQRVGMKWDLQNASWVENHFLAIEDKNLRAMAEKLYRRYQSIAQPNLSKLRKSIIHNDANDYNIIVAEASDAKALRLGLIDFGDLVYTHTINELAIASAYIVLGKDDPVLVLRQLITGYQSEFALQDIELEILFALVGMRLCVSVVNSAMQKKLHPNNPYLFVSEKSAWETIAVFARLER